MQDYFHLSMTPAQVQAISALGLAHIGDAVFELLVRGWLCAGGLCRVDHLHRETVRYVAAPAQAEFAQAILPLLTEQEADWFRRGRNAHLHTIPKNATHAQYAAATGLEALFGALYLLGQTQRVNALFAAGMEASHAV